MRRAWRRVGRALMGVVALGLAAGGALYLASLEGMGAAPEGDRLARNQRSPQWTGAHFDNPIPAKEAAPMDFLRKSLSDSGADQTPDTPPKTLALTRAHFATPPASGLRVTWLGHSTLIVEIDGARVLIDPVWGPRTAPVDFLGPKRWYETPLPLSELPDLDAVLISHDHYDHLDHRTVKQLADKGLPWLVPLGVGAHLEAWGVPAEDITELDWWEAKQVSGITLTCTPSRHFSGRRPGRFRTTLWSGWALVGPKSKVYYSGDTSMQPAFRKIGERLGPFDVTLIEAGAYDPLWTDVHLGPEQAVIAHQEVGGAVMMPVHWGTFDLAFHAWTEPIERVRIAAEAAGVTLVMPPPGGSFEPASPPPFEPWWPEVGFDRVEETPVWSTGVESVLGVYGVNP